MMTLKHLKTNLPNLMKVTEADRRWGLQARHKIKLQKIFIREKMGMDSPSTHLYRKMS
jgi:hypothetical protein